MSHKLSNDYALYKSTIYLLTYVNSQNLNPGDCLFHVNQTCCSR